VVTVEELMLAMNIALGEGSVSDDRAADVNGDGEITTEDVLQVVHAAVHGCPGAATSLERSATPHGPAALGSSRRSSHERRTAREYR